MLTLHTALTMPSCEVVKLDNKGLQLCNYKSIVYMLGIILYLILCVYSVHVCFHCSQPVLVYWYSLVGSQPCQFSKLGWSFAHDVLCSQPIPWHVPVSFTVCKYLMSLAAYAIRMAGDSMQDQRPETRESLHMTKSPGLPPLYLHTASDQILEVGTRVGITD